MCRAPAPQTRRMGPSQADPVGDVVWLHLVNIESKKLKAVIYALFHSHGTKFRTQAEPKDRAGNTYFGGETLGKAVTISERPSPAPGTPPASTRGAQSGGSSLLGLQGAGLPAGNTGNLGFQRKGVQASASPLSSWTKPHTTLPRTRPAGPSLMPPQKKRSQDQTPLNNTWMRADFLGLWTAESDSILRRASANTGQLPDSARLLNPGWQKPLVWGGGSPHPPHSPSAPHLEALSTSALLSALLFPGFPTG